jgi:hypothetical protein
MITERKWQAMIAEAEALRARLAEVEAALKLHQELDAISVSEVSRLTAHVGILESKLATAVEELEAMRKIPNSEASTGILKVMIAHTLAELAGGKTDD